MADVLCHSVSEGIHPCLFHQDECDPSRILFSFWKKEIFSFSWWPACRIWAYTTLKEPITVEGTVEACASAEIEVMKKLREAFENDMLAANVSADCFLLHWFFTCVVRQDPRLSKNNCRSESEEAL